MTAPLLTGRLDNIVERASRARIIPLTSALKHRAVSSVQVYHLDDSAPPSMIPYFTVPVRAGAPSPSFESAKGMIDLNTFCIRNPKHTFMVRATGDSMTGIGIHDSDLLIVDRRLEAKTGRVVIAVIDGYLTVKTILHDGERTVLQPENPDYHSIDITDETGVRIWGVVTKSIHDLPR